MWPRNGRKVNDMKTTAEVFALRRQAFVKKFADKLPLAEQLWDYRRCFAVADREEPEMHGPEFHRLLKATTGEQVETAAGYLARVGEPGPDSNGQPRNPLGHTIMSLFLMRPDVSPLVLRHSGDYLSRIRRDRLDPLPLLSLNDFSLVTSLLQYEIPKIVPARSYNELCQALRLELGPAEPAVEERCGINPCQTDRAARLINDFLQKIRGRWVADTALAQRPVKLAAVDDLLAALRVRQGRGIDFTYAPKDLDFFLLGDQAGDCSAFSLRKLRDNVFHEVPIWTAIPTYQVLVGCSGGRFVMKFHLLLASWRDNWTLFIDATEATPLVKEGSLKISPSLMAVRQEVFDAGLEQIRQIGRRVGNVPVIAESFSNNAWLRGNYGKLPPKVINVSSDLRDDLIREGVTNLVRENSRDLPPEQQLWQCSLGIQIRKEGLYDQGLNKGYKIARIVAGAQPDTAFPYRQL
jgi:hypothetical protein